jgi:hypothetical protein
MTAKRHKLTDEQKIKVVQRLAGFDPPFLIRKWLREECGVSITPRALEYYDPNCYAGRHLLERWKSLFLATRKAIKEGSAEIGAANKMVRVRWLDGMVHDAMNKGDARFAAELLAQVAREMGESYTNRHRLEHTGKDGGPVEVKEVTDRQRARALAALINKAKAAPAEPAPAHADPATPEGGR